MEKSTNLDHSVKMVPCVKILTLDEYTILDQTGEFKGSPVDIKDGFIHLSYDHQVNSTISKWFIGHNTLYLVVFEPSHYDCRVENGFPHFYNDKLLKKHIISVEKRSL